MRCRIVKKITIFCLHPHISLLSLISFSQPNSNSLLVELRVSWEINAVKEYILYKVRTYIRWREKGSRCGGRKVVISSNIYMVSTTQVRTHSSNLNKMRWKESWKKKLWVEEMKWDWSLNGTLYKENDEEWLLSFFQVLCPLWASYSSHFIFDGFYKWARVSLNTFFG